MTDQQRLAQPLAMSRTAGLSRGWQVAFRCIGAQALLLALACYPTATLSAPVGGEVVAGEGHIEQQGQRTDVTQHSQRLVVDWQEFNVGEQEHVHFEQPSTQSSVLNRIYQGNESRILGQTERARSGVAVKPERGAVRAEFPSKRGRVGGGGPVDGQRGLHGRSLRAGRQPGRGPGAQHGRAGGVDAQASVLRVGR